MIIVVMACVAIPLIFVILLHLVAFPKQPRYLVELFLNQGTSRGPFAHRGGRPENTLVAMTRSYELGSAGVEVDLCFSKDGQPVLIHDLTVDRTSDGIGRVNDMTLAHLKTLDFGSKTGR